MNVQSSFYLHTCCSLFGYAFSHQLLHKAALPVLDPPFSGPGGCCGGAASGSSVDSHGHFQLAAILTLCAAALLAQAEQVAHSALAQCFSTFCGYLLNLCSHLSVCGGPPSHSQVRTASALRSSGSRDCARRTGRGWRRAALYGRGTQAPCPGEGAGPAKCPALLSGTSKAPGCASALRLQRRLELHGARVGGRLRVRGRARAWFECTVPAMPATHDPLLRPKGLAAAVLVVWGVR